MAFAPRHETGKIRSRLHLSSQEVKNITKYVHCMQKKMNENIDHRKICILFDTIKSVFGEQVFKGLLKFPLQSRRSCSFNATSDHWVSNNAFSVSDCSLDSDGQGVYIEEITMYFKAHSIMHIFNKQQQQFLGKNGLDSFPILFLGFFAIGL
eukprot:UN06802